MGWEFFNAQGERSGISGGWGFFDNLGRLLPVGGSGGGSPLTTKGDVYTYSTADDRLPVGANGQFLSADNSTSTGLKWTTPSGGGDVLGPASAVANNVVFFDGTTGKLIKDSGLSLSGVNTGDQDLSGLVPYTGAAAALDLGAHNLTVDTNTLLVNSSTHRVGIGAASPVEKLEVNGAIKLDTTANTNAGTIRWTGTDFEGYKSGAWVSLTGSGSGDVVGPSSAVDGGIALFDGTTGKLLKDGGTSTLSLDTINQRVGVKVASPSTTLDVGGDISYSGDLKLYSTNGRSDFGWGADNGGNFEIYSKTTTYTGREGNIKFIYGGGSYGKIEFAHYNGSTFTTLAALDKDGNLGIGTDSPGRRLEIAGGNASLDNDKYFYFKTAAGAISDCYIGRKTGDAMAIVFDQNNLRIIAKDGDNVRIEDSGENEKIRLSPEGDSYFNVSGHNLGIGTSTPGTKLEVTGISTSYVAAVASGLGHVVYGGDGKAACLTVGTGAATFLFEDSGRFGVQARTRAQVIAGSAGGTEEKFTVLANGKVGIGVNSPHDALEINTTGEAAILSVIAPAGGAYNSEVRIGEQTYDSASSIYAGAVRYNTSNEFEFGTYDGSATFIRSLHLERGSAYTFIDGTLELVGNSVSDISNNVNSGRQILQIRGKDTLTNGSGINLYGSGDSLHPNEIRLFTGGSSTRVTIDASGNVGIGLDPTANMGGLSIEAGILTLKETTTPTADTNYVKIYSKSDNKLYFQDGAGTEHEIAFV